MRQIPAALYRNGSKRTECFKTDPAGVLLTVKQSGMQMKEYDFRAFKKAEISGNDPNALGDPEQSLLYAQAEYCQAMTDADIDTLRRLVSEDMVYTHMSGKKQTREEYFADIAQRRLRYYTVGIADPVIEINGSKGRITYTAVLNANAYGARGTFHMKGTHYYELRGGSWTGVNR